MSDAGRRDLVIFGTGTMGELISEHFDLDSRWRVVAFTADERYITEPEFLGRPLIPFDRLTERYGPAAADLFVALSYGRTNRTRRDAYLRAKAKGYTLASYVSRHARSLRLIEHGDNVFINETTVQPHARIGSNVTIWSNNVIGHDAVVGDHTFISSGVVISGFVEVGPSCFFGVNSCTRESITIGEGTVVGAGVTLLRSTRPHTMYVSTTPKPRELGPDADEFLVRPRFGVVERD